MACYRVNFTFYDTNLLRYLSLSRNQPLTSADEQNYRILKIKLKNSDILDEAKQNKKC